MSFLFTTVLPRAIRLFGAGVLSALLGSAALAHEVTVYAYVTSAGRRLPAPTSEKPAHSLLIDGGRREVGDVRAGLESAAPAQVDSLVRRALRVNAYEPLRVGEPAALVVVYHWGRMSPEFVAGPAGQDLESGHAQLLELVGGRTLGFLNLESERAAILSAATEERCFLVVSAYDCAAYTAKKTRVLLWRAQMSVPGPGLSEEQALPLLAAAGGALFGRETPQPRRIDIDVAGMLRSEASPGP